MLATDFSERSDRALRRAVILARAHGARIELVHVVDDDRPRSLVEQEAEQARRLLTELARSLETLDGLSCGTRLLCADPFAGIAQAAREADPDLLVIGPHRRRLLRDVFVGTTAERTIRTVGCPVLMVNGAPVGPYRNVLLTTDLSDNSRLALQACQTLGIPEEGRSFILNVFDAPALRLAMSGTIPKDNKDDYVKTLQQEAAKDLAAFMATLGNPRMERILRQNASTVAHEIFDTGAEVKADLIVVSTQGKGNLSRMVLGSVTEDVLRASPLDVLAIPPFR